MSEEIKKLMRGDGKNNKRFSSFGKGSSDWAVTPPRKQISSVEPLLYQVMRSDIGVPTRFVHGSFQKNILEKASKYDFTGCDHYDTLKSEAIRFFGSQQFYKDINVRHYRGAILYGPPGTGKSAVAYGVAHELTKIGVPSYLIDNIGAMEEFVTLDLPGLVIIDEIERLGAEASVMIDLMVAGQFLIATTNEMNKLHSRLTARPGRFDRRYEIARMTPGLVRELCKKYKVESCIDYINERFHTITPAMIAEISIRHNIYKEDPMVAVKGVHAEFGGGVNYSENESPERRLMKSGILGG